MGTELILGNIVVTRKGECRRKVEGILLKDLDGSLFLMIYKKGVSIIDIKIFRHRR
ncbi:hypothetical protein [Bacillus sp. FJAT-18017]|uniref:hypothetical protein n=1 Tax=Bacillus sp. FJAT-18017 TaxID=1705566 RepID=UPI000A86247F|nr:hypothetical protein [Bacillus sp. FJAT-18017]